jgi:hypothetical protein
MRTILCCLCSCLLAASACSDDGEALDAGADDAGAPDAAIDARADAAGDASPTSISWYTFHGASAGRDRGESLAIDASGDLYLAGTSSASWDGPDGEAPLRAFDADSAGDDLVLKLDASGAYVWHTFYPESGSTPALAVDDGGDVYLAASATAAWDGPDGQSPLHAFTGDDDNIVVLKLDPDGAYVWHTFLGSGFSAAVGVDGAGVLVTGVSGAAWSGPDGQSPLHAFNADGEYDADLFVVELDAAGAYQWHTFYGSADGDYGTAIAVGASGHVYVAGISYSTWDGPGGESPRVYGSGNLVVLALDAGGAYLWHTFSDGSFPSDLVVDGSESLYLTGTTLSWDGPAGQSPLHPYSGTVFEEDLYVLKLDAGGAYQWHTFYGSADWDGGTSLDVDASGSVRVTGDSAMTWDGPDGQSPLRDHLEVYDDDAFVLALDPDGAYQWHAFYGGTAGESGRALSVDASGAVFVAGVAVGAWSAADPSPVHAYSGDEDIFVLKLTAPE